jgi:hypothetical protein
MENDKASDLINDVLCPLTLGTYLGQDPSAGRLCKLAEISPN